MTAQDAARMPVDDIIRSSLKEYLDQRIGVVRLDVDNDDYQMRIGEVLAAVKETTKHTGRLALI